MSEDLRDAAAYVTRDGTVTNIDHCAMLADMTGTSADEWESGEGPDTRCGVDHYYYHEVLGMDARINDDQGMLDITILDEDGDEVATGSLDLSELEEDEDEGKE